MATDNAALAVLKKSSAARRIVVGTALGLAAAAAVFTYQPVVALLVAAWSVLATLEFLQLLRRADVSLNRWLLPLVNVAVIAAAWRGWLPGFLIAPIAVVFLAAVAARDTRPRTPVYGLFVVFYLGFMPAHLVMLKNAAVTRGLSPWLVLFPLVLAWVNDTGALVVGRLIGRRKLAPQVSPSKTIEGYVGGLVVSAILAALYLRLFVPFSCRPVWWLAFVGIGLGTIAQAGDLFESVFKRAVGVKDSSSALADHGGFLDRIDSLLFTVPAFYYLILHLH